MPSNTWSVWLTLSCCCDFADAISTAAHAASAPTRILRELVSCAATLPNLVVGLPGVMLALIDRARARAARTQETNHQVFWSGKSRMHSLT